MLRRCSRVVKKTVHFDLLFPLCSESDVLKRLDMLSRENDLLVEQQGEVETELSRAQRQLTVTTSESEQTCLWSQPSPFAILVGMALVSKSCFLIPNLSSCAFRYACLGL